MKTQAEIKAEIIRLGAIVLEHRQRHARGEIEGISAMLMVQALAWAIGKSPDPAVRLRRGQFDELMEPAK